MSDEPKYLVMVIIAEDTEVEQSIAPMVDGLEVIEYGMDYGRTMEMFDDLVFEGKEFA